MSRAIERLEAEEFSREEEESFLKAKQYAIKKGWNYTRFKSNKSIIKYLKTKSKKESYRINLYKLYCSYISLMTPETISGFLNWMNETFNDKKYLENNK